MTSIGRLQCAPLFDQRRPVLRPDRTAKRTGAWLLVAAVAGGDVGSQGNIGDRDPDGSVVAPAQPGEVIGVRRVGQRRRWAWKRREKRDA